MNNKLFYARHNIAKKAKKMSPQTIQYYDLTILLSGRLVYNINGTTITMESGDAIFIPAGSIRERSESAGNENYISFNFYSGDEYHLPLVMRSVVHSEITLLIAAFDEIEKHNYFDSNMTTVEHLFNCILSVLENTITAQQHTPLIRKIIEYIHSDISRKITLEDIGKATSFSPIYCETAFRKEVGKPIMDYVLDRRIDEAKKLLITDTTPLVEIAQSVGFNDYNYFSRVFKKRSGCSPTEYRRRSFTKTNI